MWCLGSRHYCRRLFQVLQLPEIQTPEPLQLPQPQRRRPRKRRLLFTKDHFRRQLLKIRLYYHVSIHYSIVTIQYRLSKM